MRLSGHKTRSVFLRYDITSFGDIEDAANKIERGSKVFENRTDTTTSTDDDSDATLEAPMTM